MSALALAGVAAAFYLTAGHAGAWRITDGLPGYAPSERRRHPARPEQHA